MDGRTDGWMDGLVRACFNFKPSFKVVLKRQRHLSYKSVIVLSTLKNI